MRTMQEARIRSFSSGQMTWGVPSPWVEVKDMLKMLVKKFDLLFNRNRRRMLSKLGKVSLILDRSSGLPIWVSILPQIEEAMEQKQMAMIYIDLKGFKDIEALCGREICQNILFNTGTALRNLEISFYGQREKLLACSLGGDDFLIFIEAPLETPDFEQHYADLRTDLEEVINKANPEYCGNRSIAIHMGYVDLDAMAPAPIESLVYEATKKAIFMAKSFSDAWEHAQWRSIKQILEQGLVRSVYQPIVSLKSGKVAGFEALSRGPDGSDLNSPTRLFALAERYKCLLDLELLCHKKAVGGIGKDFGDRFLFLNISPSILAAGNYQQVLTDLLRVQGISPRSVVLELTERNPIEDYTEFRDVLNAYRVAGYLIAIDDAGAGYSSLQAIAELQAEFVKVDLSLVRDIDQNSTKKALLETLVDFCNKVGSRIICEGIETTEELKVLAALGCDYGQGYLLGRPGALDAEINRPVDEILQAHARPLRIQYECSTQIGDIVIYQNPVTAQTPVEKVIEIFNHNKAVNGLVVCHDQEPVGLIMRDRLFYTLGTRYGYELLTRKRAEDIMDREPLILSHETPIEDSARLVAERVDQGISDYLVVVKGSKYFGLVSVGNMLNAMAQAQIEQAKDANPLTGLPGNRCITRRINEALDQNLDFSVLYVDLDNFKAFNDYFGFEYGDRALLYLSTILSDVVEQHPSDDGLLGHIGGDDFIIITAPEQAEAIATEVIHQFEARIAELYAPGTLQQGYIVTSDRQGKLVQMPMMTLSIAGVYNHSVQPFPNHLALAEAAAEVKCLAKATSGCSYIFDRRRPVTREIVPMPCLPLSSPTVE